MKQKNTSFRMTNGAIKELLISDVFVIMIVIGQKYILARDKTNSRYAEASNRSVCRVSSVELFRVK
jgi:hypothetical protein